MNARPLHVMLLGATVILPTIVSAPIFAEPEKPVWDVQELYKQCVYKGKLEKIFCLEFVSSVARPAFTNGSALKDRKDLTGLGTIAIRSACPKSSISNDAIVKAFSEWANEHLEKWSASAEAGVMQAMHDTWPCF